MSIIVGAWHLSCNPPSRDQEKGDVPLVPTAESAREVFCDTVFAHGDVERITGVAGLVPRRSTRAIEPGVGECQLARGDGPETLVEVALAVDCRPIHPQLASLRKASASAPGFREVDIGIGGIYLSDPAIAMHRLVFISEQPSCAVHVSTVRVETDVTTSLARHVAARITTRTQLD